ncbi:hypothetical protein GFL38_24315 [Rhizobium leguminosarum bv. viciae]|uniref:hypothetical protein n=1 Tax=Rhizobium ruizarguesonis TaxID=2081791 RepID=UPI00143F4B41|nr:hypothetical protein [Rhizobium ruizarguesonis]MBC2806137.1 hypothetical protein [Rhizobium ruizarguesonis]NKJ75330.1 hypothetical protein [Rhizobium leguminosarum bv. viciae]
MTAATVSFEARDFARGFVAALIELGNPSIQPKNPEHRLGLYRVWKYLEESAESARKDDFSRNWYKALVRIRNRVSPGVTGSFDQFQTDLRDLQLSLTESPNPSYEEISFNASEPFARSLLGHLKHEESELVRKAAQLFLESASSLNATSH